MKVTMPIEVQYPSGDGKPVAETFAHFYAIAMTVELLRLYLEGQQATILGNQFMYYQEGDTSQRTAPDVMVIFGVAPGGRDNYKIWAEGAVPRVVFEMTSPKTRKEDEGRKKELYEQLGIQEYWQFDPKGQWIREGLRGYQLVQETYQVIDDQISSALGLRLVVQDGLIAFYRLDTGEKLLLPVEMKAALMAESQRRELAEQEVLTARQTAEIAKQAVLVARQETLAAKQEAIELAAQLAAYKKSFGTLESND